MPRLVALTVVLLVVVAPGCGRSHPAIPSACTAGPAQIAGALRAAPGPVALAGGTRLSACVERARADADIQTIGALYTAVADGLAPRAARSDAAATQLGYLIGATRRGASHTNGIHVELVRRLEQTSGIDHAPAQRRAAFDRGLAAGSRSG